jgi:hypothetical protein
MEKYERISSIKPAGGNGDGMQAKGTGCNTGSPSGDRLGGQLAPRERQAGAEEPLERRCPSALGPSAQYEDFDRQAMGTKDECQPHDAKTSLIDGKAPSERPALKP